MIDFSHPLLSIVIPTRDRAETARYAIKTSLHIPSHECEVIVHDCGQSDELEKSISEMPHDDRLQYFRVKKKLNMTENWNCAITKVRGEYVIFIGDDDAVNPHIMEIVRWAKREDLDCICHANSYRYFWPTYSDTSKAGTLRIITPTGKKIYPNPQKVRYKNSFGPKMHNYKLMPEVYQSIIRFNLVELLYKKTNQYFNTLMPDVYFAYAIMPFIKKYCFFDYPLALDGSSGKSNSGKVLSINMQEYEKDYYTRESWPAVIPHTYTFISYYAAVKYQAYRYSGQDDLIKNINVPLVYSHCFVNSPHTVKKYADLLKQYKISRGIIGLGAIKGFFLLGIQIVYVICQRINLKMPYSLHVFDRNNNIYFKRKPDCIMPAATIEDAIVKLLAFLKSKNIVLEHLIARYDT